MDKKDAHQKRLQEIYSSKSYDKLRQYTKNDFWHCLEKDERQLLAELLVLQGEELLEQGDERVFEVFDKAHEISPDDSLLYYVQGVVLGSVKDSARCFSQACKCFETAAKLDPESFEARFFWGKTLLQRAEDTENEELALEAESLFHQASKKTPEDKDLEASLFWNWGMLYAFLGRLHGEAIDLKKALSKFDVAASLGHNSADFWEHYGHVVCELGSLLNNPQSLVEGRKYFKKALETDKECGSARLSLAFCEQKLYEIFAKEEDYHAGCEAFELAQPFNEKDSQFWYRWGILLFLYGRMNCDLGKIKESLDKFKEAHECEPDNPLIASKWAEAEMVYGIYTERIDYLRQAEARIISSLKLQDNNPEAWFIYGSCLNEMGRYFAESSYYLQAIEKFQYGLYLSPNDAFLSQGISLSYYSIGEMKNDVSLIELSIIYSEKAIQDSKTFNPHFYNDLGVALMKMAELTSDKSYLESAVEKYEIALANFNENNPETYDPEWLYNYGCARDFLGDFYEDASYYERAIQILTTFLQIDPTYLHVHYNLASAYSHLGELVGDVDCYHKAIEHFQKFLAEDNEDELVWNDYGLTLLNLADLLYDPSLPNLSQVCFGQAEEKFLHAISLGNSNAFYNLACLYSLTGHHPQAMHYMEKAEQQHSLPPLEEIMDDEWLENLRQTQQFRTFLSNLSTRKSDNKPT